MKRVVVIGAGVGGLVTAAALTRAGLDVTVLEAQVYPGGCASTFFHQGFRFDTGATLAAGFYPGGPMDQVGQAAGIDTWPVMPAESAMVVHLPDSTQVNRWTGEARWEAYRAAFGERSLDFFRWQEHTADALWDLALRQPPWPPQTPGDALEVVQTGLSWLARRGPAAALSTTGLAVDAFRPLAPHLDGLPEALRLFIDAQLLISAQATSASANALYGASALDLPRRGVVYLKGGMGAIAEVLVNAIRQQGGRVLFRQPVTRILTRNGMPTAVETKRGETFPADLVISNLTPWNTAELFTESAPNPFSRLPAQPEGWGAFMVYIGLDGEIIPEGLPLHHQVVLGRPMGGGNTVFASLSPAWDDSRAPAGQRALTLSTHVTLAEWWRLHEQDPDAYQAHKTQLAEKVLETAELALPGLRQAAKLILPGTPVTFERFTGRKMGWVGGFPQTSLLRSIGPRVGQNIWMVGDSIFPGQSTAAVALGGLRVARMAMSEMGMAVKVNTTTSRMSGHHRIQS